MKLKKKISKGEKFCVRFKTVNKELKVNDLVQGIVKFDSKLIGDFIIVKSDGFPSYNYAVVIDDYEMKITNVIRGVGHLSNTPRQILIHHALDFELPSYAHISEIVGTDKKKLSKRRGAMSVLLFKEMGYLNSALNNYMSLLGWYPRDNQEFMKMEELEKKFDLNHCSKSPAMFDFFNIKEDEQTISNNTINQVEELKKNINKKSKLNWLNNLHLKEVKLEDLWKLFLDNWVKKDLELNELVKKNEVKVLNAFDNTRKYVITLADSVLYLKELFQDNFIKLKGEAYEFFASLQSQNIIENFKELLIESKPTTPNEFIEIIKTVGEKNKVKGHDLYMPIRIAVSGKMEGLELPILFSILGVESNPRKN